MVISQRGAVLSNLSPFNELGNLLAVFQEPEIGPCSRPAKYSPYLSFLSLNSILIFSSHLSLDHLLASFFLSGFLTDILCADLVCRFYIPATFFFHLMVTDIVKVKEGKLLSLPY